MTSKKLFLTALVITIFAATVVVSQPVTRNSAIFMVKNQILQDDTLNFNIYMYPTVYPFANCPLRNGDTIFNPYAFSRFFFIDEMPHYNWGHTCSYIFIDTISGYYQRIHKQFFPFGYKEYMDSISESFDNDYHNPIFPSQTPPIYTNDFDPNKYAILFSGDWNDLRWNDLSHMYSALKLNGFKDENIYLFVPEEALMTYNWDPNIDQEGPDDVDGYCTYDNIENTLNDLSEILTEKDIFFFYCSTHGGYETLLAVIPI